MIPPTCCRAAQPLCHNYWDCAESLGAEITDPMCCNYRSPSALESILCGNRSHHNERPPITSREEPLLSVQGKPAQQQRPWAAQDTEINTICEKWKLGRGRNHRCLRISHRIKWYLVVPLTESKMCLTQKKMCGVGLVRFSVSVESTNRGLIPNLNLGIRSM